MSVVPHVELDSESIESLDYDPDDCVLEVRFRSDGRYRYFDVPAEVVIELLEAESAGAWFNQQFKAFGFDYQRVD